MQEFSSISVSSYEAAALADRLTEHAADGWSVVSIVPTGSTITAYLCRATEGGTEPAPEVATAEPVAAAPVATEPEPEPVAAAPVASEPVPEPVPEPVAAEAVVAEAVTEEAPVAEPAAEPQPEPAPEPAAQAAAAPSVAAGWYADPSGRFELRYWDGGQWTEHVARGGQQYTDPPVA